MTPEEETFITLQEPAPVIDEYGNKFWRNEEGNMHRDNDLPAIIWADGTFFWFKNGKWHRENAPAITWPNGREEYFENGIQIK